RNVESVQYREGILVCTGRAGEIELHDEAGRVRQRYTVPYGAHLFVTDGQAVEGDPLVKTRREASKTRDITGGLPRVAELFEARRPKDAAVVSEIDGRLEFGGVSRGMRKLIVRGEDGETREYQD